MILRWVSVILFILQSNIRPNTTKKKSDCGQFTLYDLGSTDLRFFLKPLCGLGDVR